MDSLFFCYSDNRKQTKLFWCCFNLDSGKSDNITTILKFAHVQEVFVTNKFTQKRIHVETMHQLEQMKAAQLLQAQQLTKAASESKPLHKLMRVQNRNPQLAEKQKHQFLEQQRQLQMQHVQQKMLEVQAKQLEEEMRKNFKAAVNDFSKPAAIDIFDNLLDFVDFGEQANLFLKNCGVEETPSAEQFALNLVKNYQRYLVKNGVRKYLKLLLHFSAVFQQLLPGQLATSRSGVDSSNINVIKKLSQSNFCLAYVYKGDQPTSVETAEQKFTSSRKVKEKEEEDDDNDISSKETREEIAITTKASQCFLIDNERFSKLFNPPRVPNSSSFDNSMGSFSSLEKMYEVLGSKWITSEVKTNCVPKGAVATTERTQRLKEKLVERKYLLLNNMNGKRRKNLKLNAEEMIEQLKVYQVDKIERTLLFQEKKIYEQAGVSIMKLKDGKVGMFIMR